MGICLGFGRIWNYSVASDQVIHAKVEEDEAASSVIEWKYLGLDNISFFM